MGKQDLWARREVPKIHMIAILATEFSRAPQVPDDVSGNGYVPALQVERPAKPKVALSELV